MSELIFGEDLANASLMVTSVFWVLLIKSPEMPRVEGETCKSRDPLLPRVWDDQLWLRNDKILAWMATRLPASLQTFPYPWAPPGCRFKLCHQSCLQG